MATLGQCIAWYVMAARQSGKSDATVRQYDWHLRKMAAWLARRGMEGVGEVGRDVIREWGAGLRDSWAPATVKQAVCAARSFFAWCAEEGLIGADPGRALVVPRVPVRLQRTLTGDEVALLLAACDLSTDKGVRDAALVSLLVDSGLRAGEICRLRVTNAELELGLLTVVGKGGDEGAAYFGRATAGRLEAWLEVRWDWAVVGVGTVFVSVGGNTPGRPLTTRGLRMVLRRLGDQAGVRGVSPHAFRRAFACIGLEAGASSREVQMAGRWGDIRMVERYTPALRVRELYRRWSPADFIENGSDP